MAARRGATPRVVELADRLNGLIGRRRLRPGDSFLSAAEAAKELRVSMTLANRALQLLHQRGVIDRRRRAGSVVLPQSAVGRPDLQLEVSNALALVL